MNHQPSTCEEDIILRFLNDELGFAEQNSFEQHLDECDECCRRLGNLTAAQEQWNDVAAQLSKTEDCETIDYVSSNSTLPIALDFLAPTDDPQMLGRFAGYEIVGVIGVGGMGIVMKGFDRTLNRFVAIKALLPSYASSGAARKRFAREARAAAAVVHENVIEIHGVSVDSNGTSNHTQKPSQEWAAESKPESLPYLVMPYVRGESLQKRLNRSGSLVIDEILRISMQIAAGLSAAHQQGLVHRDIKPANILLPEGVDRVKLTDFGLARAADDASLTRTGVIAGTPQYMSPEQANGDAVTTKSDLFSLGSVMYAMCTGRIPFRAESPLSVLRRIIDEAPRPIREINPDIPGWLCAIIESLHAKSPADRPKSANEVANTLQLYLAHLQQPDAVAIPDDATGPQPTTLTSTVFSKLRNQKGTLLMFSSLSLALIGILFAQSAWQPTLNENPALSSRKNLGVTQELELSDETTESQSDHNEVYKKNFSLAFAQPDEIGDLIVDIKQGSIDIESYDGRDIKVTLTVPNLEPETNGNPAEGLVQLQGSMPDFDITQSGNRIKIDSSDYQFISNLEIKVPRNINLNLDSYRNGDIRVTGTTGKLRIHTQNNNVLLSQISGSVAGWSYNGSFEASFESVQEGNSINLESYNGSIDITLPDDIKADTRIRTATGKMLTNFDIQVQEQLPVVRSNPSGSSTIELDEFVLGKINGGGPAVSLETEKGDIRLRKRMNAQSSDNTSDQ